MKRKVLIYPDPKLREVSRPVTKEDDVKALCDDLVETMMTSGGAGLSAIQVGEPLRIFVVRNMKPDEKPLVLINPTWKTVLGFEAKHVVSEGCLSFPGFFSKTERFEAVEATYQDPEGVEYSKVFRDQEGELTAQVIQHETEHLDGKLLLDNLGFTQVNKLKTHMKQYARRPQETILKGMGIDPRMFKMAQKGRR
jgi:peptide deformylase